MSQLSRCIFLWDQTGQKQSGTRWKVKVDNGQEMAQSGPEVIKVFSSSAQLSMKFQPLINV